MSKRRILSGLQFHDRPTREQRQASIDNRRRHEAAARIKCDGLLFWKVCRNKRCRRQHGCSGRDPEDCWKTKWPLLPSHVHEAVRLMVKFRHDGMTPMEAFRAAEAAMARYREQEAELAASCAALASPAAAVAPAAAADIAMDVVIEPPSPRVRKM